MTFSPYALDNVQVNLPSCLFFDSLHWVPPRIYRIPGLLPLLDSMDFSLTLVGLHQTKRSHPLSSTNILKHLAYFFAAN